MCLQTYCIPRDHYLEIWARPDEQVLNRSALLQISANIGLQVLHWILSIVALARLVLVSPLIHTVAGESETDTSDQGMGGREEKWKEENNLWPMQRPKKIAFCKLQGPAGRLLNHRYWSEQRLQWSQHLTVRCFPRHKFSLHRCAFSLGVEGWGVCCGHSPGRFSIPFICMRAALRWLRKQKTCNCFHNLNNISSLETLGEKSLSNWQVEMAWWWMTEVPALTLRGHVGWRKPSSLALFASTVMKEQLQSWRNVLASGKRWDHAFLFTERILFLWVQGVCGVASF